MREYDEAMVMVEEAYMPLTLSAPHLTDEEFQELCDKYSDYRLEYSADGELFIMPPTDPETGARNAAITKRLGIWADAVRRGVVTDFLGTDYVAMLQDSGTPLPALQTIVIKNA